MVWKPHVTVAAVIEQNQRFLVVEEETANGLAFNQPAGHLEEGEDFITAVKREVLEETAWHFTPTAFLGVYMWRKNPESPTFLRLCFSGQAFDHNPEQALDTGIVQAHWLTRAEVAKQPLRSLLVINCIDDYIKGERYPLSVLQSFLDFNLPVF
jgi:ADP-ribose pyrophosphatase YjhB (NUDIX family)